MNKWVTQQLRIYFRWHGCLGFKPMSGRVLTLPLPQGTALLHWGLYIIQSFLRLYFVYQVHVCSRTLLHMSLSSTLFL